jgi:hypothetical protein
MSAIDNLIAALQANKYSDDPQNIICPVDLMVAAFQTLSPFGALPSADIIVGSAANLPAAVAMTGDVGITNTGLTTIAKIGGVPVVAGGSSLQVPTTQILTATGNYNPQLNQPSAGLAPRLIVLEMIGGGAGGGGGGVGDGGNGVLGSDTTWNGGAFVAKGGSATSSTGSVAGAPGSGGAGAGLSLVGSSGTSGGGTSATQAQIGGAGGDSILGGGSGIAATAAPGNGGGGRGGNEGAAAGGTSGAGGAPGEYRRIFIPNPGTANIPFVIGAAGAGGAGGTSGTAGSAGKLGIIIVTEYW